MPAATTAAAATATMASSTSTTDAEIPRPELACSACNIKFDNKELQREHMREDWHVNNLRRRVASLPPLSALVFHEQVLAPSTTSGKKSATESSPFQKSCDVCDKHYTTPKAWRAHLRSRNHNQQFTPQDPTSKSPDYPEEEIFNSSQCLFCTAKATSLNSNLKHMSQAHSFFISDPEYLIDIESLLSYLFIVISDFHECIYCGNEKNSAFAAREHMRMKGHCRLDPENESMGLEGFWDFDGDESEAEEASKEDEGDEDEVLVPDDDGELRLPSGKTITHRSRARPSRHHHSGRRISPRRELLTEAEMETEEVPTGSSANTSDRRLVMRAGTSTSMIGVPELQQRALVAVEREMEMKEMRKRNEYQSWLEKGANQQKRFKVKSMGKKQGGLEKRLG